MKSTDIPNGFIVLAKNGKPVLVDFDDGGEPIQEGTEIAEWSYEKNLPYNMVVLVHTVKGEKEMLIRGLQRVQIMSKQGKPVSAVELGMKNELMLFVKNIRAEYIRRIEAKEKIEK